MHVDSRRGSAETRRLVNLLDGWAVIATCTAGWAASAWEAASTTWHTARHATSTALSTIKLLQKKLAYVQ